MRLNFVTSLIVLLLATASIGGATMAWFIGDADGGSAVFTAGTVIISDPIVSSNQNWQPGQCETVSWSIANNGSKKAYIRVKPEVDIEFENTQIIYIASHVNPGSETAWVGVPGSDPRFITIPSGQSWNQYFAYELGNYTQENPLVKKILSTSNFREDGYVEIWDDRVRLYLNYHLYSLTTDEINIYAGLTPPNRHAPGQLGWSFRFSPRVSTFSFDTEYIYNMQGGQANVSIADLLGSAAESITYELHQSSANSWVLGSDGWWYYATPSGLTEVAVNEVISIFFIFCVDEDFDGTVNLSLKAEAVQVTHNAADYTWPDKPF